MNQSTVVTDLRCAYLINPLGIEDLQPRLSWRLETPRAGAVQIAYRVVCASSPKLLSDPDLWDSGQVQSNETAVPYGGQPLNSRQRVFWRVQVQDETGATVSSENAAWEMGLLRESDWRASWISGTLYGGPRTPAPAPFLRRVFQITKPLAHARLYATALGVYECEINGRRVSDEYFAPGWTDYTQRVQYQSYDVSELVLQGDNCWGAVLGDGWYCGNISWMGRQVYGDKPKFFAQLELEYQDGSREQLVTDGSWTHGYGPILGSDMLMGETYDARHEFGGWSTAAFDGGNWNPVELPECPAVQLSAPLGPPVRAIEVLKPIGEPQNLNRNLIYDFGQNLTGRVRIKVRGKGGTTLRLRFAETLQGGPAATSGPIYTDNLRSAIQTDYYTLKGGGSESWEPRFTFHGFRFVEVYSWGVDLEELELEAVVLHSDNPRRGDFECDDDLVNQLQRNIDWGWRGNSLDVPTDCPQRDERLGWTGDAQVFIGTSLFNRDATAFWREWARDTADAQYPSGSVPRTVPLPEITDGETDFSRSSIYDGGPAWADAAVICPWTNYLYSGDTALLSESYDVIRRYVEYLNDTQRDGVRCYEGCTYCDGHGDWLALDGGSTMGNTPRDLLGTAFFAFSSHLAARTARVLGREEDAARFEGYFELARAAFNREFVTPAGRIIPGTQTCYVLALHFNLLPEELRPTAAGFLAADIRRRGNKLATGFVGTSYLPFALSRFGHLDLAYELLFQKGWPSWLYAVTQGATTIWERWDGWTQDAGFQTTKMNSFNHYAYGAIGDWLYQVVAGIQLDEENPGYRRIILAPQPGTKLKRAQAYFDSPQGRIESAWHFQGDSWIWHGLVPPNTTTLARIPGLGNAEAYERELQAGEFEFVVQTD